MKPTRSDARGWFIPMFDDTSPWYIYILTSIPALLLTILLFMDQQITSVIVNRKEHKLKVRKQMLLTNVLKALILSERRRLPP